MVWIAPACLGAAMSCAYRSRRATSTDCASSLPSPFSQTEYRPFQLINVYDESHDTKVYRFALPSSDMSLNLEVSSCVTLRYANDKGEEIVRPYTPLNRIDQVGYFDILVKKYKGAKMANHLSSMKRYDSIDVKGPWMKLPIKANQYKCIGMMAGGTGIAPMYQIARNILQTPKNTTDISLIYANKRKEDVLLGNELNELMENHAQFSPYFILSKAPSDWMGGVGYISKEIIKSLMPPPNRAADSIILICGPPSFMDTICGDKDFSTNPPSQGELRGYLKELGYMPRMIYKF